jgi:hypothetical protein
MISMLRVRLLPLVPVKNVGSAHGFTARLARATMAGGEA